MSVEAMALVLHHSRASGTAKVILMGIANHQGDGGAWPAIATLARYGNVQERAVVKIIRHLEQLGEVLTDPRAGRSNRYVVTVVCPSNCDRSMNHKVIHTPVLQDTPLTPVLQDTPVPQDTPTPVPQDTPPLSHRTPEPSMNPTSNQRGSSPASTTDRTRDVPGGGRARFQEARAALATDTKETA